MNKNHSSTNKWLVTIMYLIMIASNAAAVMLPINGLTTEEVSNTYDNLFTPTGLTFSIWSIIYLLLAGFVVYQWKKPTSQSILAIPEMNKQLSILFIVSSILNSVWLFAWQYLQIGLSVLIMLALLVVLIYMNRLLVKTNLTKSDYFLIRLPFSIYFGWITIATIANITAFLVKQNLAFLQNHQVTWTVIILLVGVLIISATVIYNHDIAYGITTIWAYFGILIKHRASDGWDGAYPAIITTVILCLIVISLVCLYEITKRIKKSS